MQRARLIVNPEATSTSPHARDVLTQALASELAFEVSQTKARGHAAELAFDAARSEVDLVLVLGGDGTVNEVVNGLLADGVHAGAPALAVVPGGSTNVFARSLGMPDDRVEATGYLLELLRAGTERTIGLGRADQRWFTFTAGLGLDADVVAQVEQKRAAGRRSSHALYVRTAAPGPAVDQLAGPPANRLWGGPPPRPDGLHRDRRRTGRLPGRRRLPGQAVQRHLRGGAQGPEGHRLTPVQTGARP